jgi:hypothetical protein
LSERHTAQQICGATDLQRNNDAAQDAMRRIVADHDRNLASEAGAGKRLTRA